jgi:hypothetical protein
MHVNIYDVYYSQCSRQHVSAGIPAIFRVRFLVQEYKRAYRSFATTVSGLKISDFSGEMFKGFEVL